MQVSFQTANNDLNVQLLRMPEQQQFIIPRFNISNVSKYYCTEENIITTDNPDFSCLFTVFNERNDTPNPTQESSASLDARAPETISSACCLRTSGQSKFSFRMNCTRLYTNSSLGVHDPSPANIARFHKHRYIVYNTDI